MRNVIKKPKWKPPAPTEPRASLGGNYSAPDLIKILGLARNTVYGHLASGAIRSVKYGRLLVISPEEVARVLKEGLPTFKQPPKGRPVDPLS